ncbi:MAG TPA: carboxypeptidase regulatory-like domain-containing protein [Anaerolineae bacterium]
MLDLTDERLSQWVGTAVGNVNVSLALPTESPSGEGVSLYLLSFANCPPPRTSDRPPLQILLRYLVTAWAATQQKSHQLLGDLAFAAMGTAEFTVDLDPPPPELWLALRLTPRPSFLLSLPVRQERPKAKVDYVRSALVVKAEPMTQLVGRLVGPGEQPVAGARVEIPSLQMFNYTDSNGQFRFMGLPGASAKRELRVMAKGRQFDVTVDSPTDANKPVVIQFDPA